MVDEKEKTADSQSEETGTDSSKEMADASAPTATTKASTPKRQPNKKKPAKKPTTRKTGAKKPAKKLVGPRPFPAETLEESMRIARLIRELNGGNPWPPTEVAGALSLAPKANRMWYLSASSRDYGLTTGTKGYRFHRSRFSRTRTCLCSYR